MKIKNKYKWSQKVWVIQSGTPKQLTITRMVFEINRYGNKWICYYLSDIIQGGEISISKEVKGVFFESTMYKNKKSLLKYLKTKT